MPAAHAVAWLLVLTVSPTAKAAVDALTQKAGRNIFERLKNTTLAKWFDARTSWARKYRNAAAGDYSARYPFSKNVLVMFTDFWHFADAVYLDAWKAALVLLSPVEGWFPCLCLFVALKGGFGATFEFFYSRVFTSKTESPPPAQQ
jgi:hypothetical protein